MKRYFFFLVFVLITLSAYPQEITSVNMPVDETTGLITYKEVVEEPGTKDELFNRCAEWLPTFYPNPWESAKVRDQSTGLIKIQHQFRVYDTDLDGNKIDAGMILYNAKIEFKQDRYRIVVDNFVLKEVSRYPVEKWLDESAPDYNPKWKNYLAQINSFVTNDMLTSLKAAMKPKKEAKEDIW
jgi:hypothetical protein